MAYTLITANRNYSSWSLRPWVLMKALSIDFEDRLEPFTQPGDIALQANRHRPQFDPHPDIHGAITSQVSEPAVHFCDCALGEHLRFFIGRPDARVTLGQIERDAERIRDHPRAVDQQGDLPGGREFAEILIIVGLGDGLDPVVEWNAKRLHQHPRAQAPA